MDSGPAAEPAPGRREAPIRVRRPGMTTESSPLDSGFGPAGRPGMTTENSRRSGMTPERLDATAHAERWARRVPRLCPPYDTPRHSGTRALSAWTRNPATGTEFVSGFRVRPCGPPRNDD